MGSTAKSILEIDVNDLIELLNKALADEWLAYYQYWIGSKVVKGVTGSTVEKELMEHAEEELKHADMLVNRIIQLGGVPLLDPQEWFKKTNCGYLAPKKSSEKDILNQNIKGERCAIVTYNAILKKIKGKDEITYHMILSIMKDEIEHEEDLEKLLENLKEQ